MDCLTRKLSGGDRTTPPPAEGATEPKRAAGPPSDAVCGEAGILPLMHRLSSDDGQELER